MILMELPYGVHVIFASYFSVSVEQKPGIFCVISVNNIFDFYFLCYFSATVSFVRILPYIHTGMSKFIFLCLFIEILLIQAVTRKLINFQKCFLIVLVKYNFYHQETYIF